MKPCNIAVGSTRAPKLKAVEEALSGLAASLAPGAAVAVRGYEVESGVGHTPVSRAELMRGARQRAEALRDLLHKSSLAANYFVGLEGGLDVVTENGINRVFLESWAYVSDAFHGHFGCSGSIELPEALGREVLHRGIELGVAIDRFAGAAGIRDGQGAWGVLTSNKIVRQESFRLAVLTAFAPFYNAKLYRQAAAAGS
jgi:inosine/xanthosine triphosphatase